MAVINITCPLCQTSEEVDVDDDIKNAEKLTTISIPDGLICSHHFQAFIDNNFNIRGYQKVQIQVGKKNIKIAKKIEKKKKKEIKKKKEAETVNRNMEEFFL